jgi:hypothetical protein
MLFRRISAHLKRQDWFAVGLDLTIVVVGIYIGLQVDAWNSTRHDRVMEREYLERLLIDMEESLEAQRDAKSLFDSSIDATDYIARIQREGTFDDVDEDRLMIGLNSIGWVIPPVTNMGTIRELQSTGNIALIQDVSVRIAIGQFERSFANLEWSALQVVEFMGAAAPEFMAWSYMEPRTDAPYDSVTDVEDASFGYVHRYDSERILKNPDAENITSWVSGWGKYHASVMAQHHEDTIVFRDLLLERLEQ